MPKKISERIKQYQVLSLEEGKQLMMKGARYVNPEYALSKRIADYLKGAYPNVLFHFDYAGLGLSKTQAGMAKAIQGDRGFTDLQILEPRGSWHSLFIELKKEGTKIYLKDGITLVADSHIREQVSMLEKLNKRGYCAKCGIGYENTVAIIDSYFSIDS